MKIVTAKRLSAVSCILFGGCVSTGGVPEVSQSQWALNATPLERSAAELDNDTQEHIAWAKTYRDRIVGVAGPRTIENTLVPYNSMMMHLDAAQSECALFARVHPERQVRAAAQEGELVVIKHLNELAVDRELYDAFQDLDTSRADPETQYVAYKILRQFRKNGVDQPAETRQRIAELQGQIAGLTQAFVKNIPEYGPPYDIPDVLRQLLAARYEVAQLMGYSTWGDYVTADTMAESAAHAQSFVQTVVDLSNGARDREYAAVMERLGPNVHPAASGNNPDGASQALLVTKEMRVFDPLQWSVFPYFSLPDVLNGLFEVTQRLFGVTYRRVHGLNLWHEDVTAWDVYDGNERIGRFYLDLYARDGKWERTAHFNYRTGIGGVRLPQSVLVCSLRHSLTTPEGVVLMDQTHVAALFSAFGHMLHNIFAGHHRWMAASGISNEADFVEVPGNAMRELCYDPDVLPVFAKHYRTREPMPSDLVEQVCRATAVSERAETARRAFDAVLALSLQRHDPRELDSIELMAELQEWYCACDSSDGTHFQFSLQDLGPRSAGRYTHVWSEMIAKDILTRFQREGMLSPKTGRLYRNTILEPGGSKKADEMVKDFLGRPHSDEAFRRWLEE
jgi:Zn-dependent oligopeptidase